MGKYELFPSVGAQYRFVQASDSARRQVCVLDAFPPAGWLAREDEDSGIPFITDLILDKMYVQGTNFVSEKTVAQKLLIKPEYDVLIANSPPDYKAKLGIPRAATSAGRGRTFDLIQLFVSTKKELEQCLTNMIPLLKPNGILWLTYPKGGKTNINRDSIREYVSTVGFQTVALVAVDARWSALRLKSIT